MCAVRFGSYSIRSTRAGDAFLVALEVDDAVVLLAAAADVARGDAAVVVAATRTCSALSISGACGAPLCRSGVTTRTAERRPGEVGLNVINAMGLLLRPWPTRRSTGLRPASRMPCASRRGGRMRILKDFCLPFTFTTFTASTVTSKIFSIAPLMSALVASVATSNTYWLTLPAGARSFRTRAAHGSRCKASPRSCQPLLDLLDGVGASSRRYRRRPAKPDPGPARRRTST